MRLKQELDDAVRELEFEEVSRLADLGAPIDMETSQGHTALTMAAAMATEAKNADGKTVLAVTLLLDREHDEPEIDHETVRGHTALTYAARNGHIFVIEELLKYKAQINRPTSLDGKTAHETTGTLEKAVADAFRDAKASGDENPIILLSPACASFDQFKDFEARGDSFREAVEALGGDALRPVMQESA